MDELDKDEILQCMMKIYIELNCFNYDYDWHRVHGFNQISKIVDDLESKLSDDALSFLGGMKGI